VLGHQLPSNYTQFLDPNALDDAVIGRDVRFFDYSYYGSGIPGDELTVAFANNTLSVMESLGATVVDVDTGTFSLTAATSSQRCCMNLERKSRTTSPRSRTQRCERWPT